MDYWTMSKSVCVLRNYLTQQQGIDVRDCRQLKVAFCPRLNIYYKLT
jgi:hypothetical protein